MKKTFKLTSLIIALILMFSLIGCTEPHEHKFVNGACECGEVHDCVYTNGTCTCGKVHDCEYVNGACSCGKVHDCEYVNGACSCGKVHDCVFTNGACTCGKVHDCEYVNGACSCGKVHDCEYVNGACTCGKEHDCEYVNGACSCGKVHDCVYENGACTCGKEHDCVYENGVCSCGKEKELTTVSDFDEFLVNTGYTESVSSRVIEYNGILLYQEDIHSTYKDNGYVNAGETKELGEDGVYLVDSFISDGNQANEVTLNLFEEFFEKFTINEKTLEGKVKDSSSEGFLFVQAKDITIKNVFLIFTSFRLKY